MFVVEQEHVLRRGIEAPEKETFDEKSRDWNETINIVDSGFSNICTCIGRSNRGRCRLTFALDMELARAGTEC